MKLGPRGLALIKDFEGLRLQAYMPTPEDVPTIGYGRTRGVKMGDTCTEAEAEAWLREDVEWAEDCVNQKVSVPLQDTEFDSLVSLVFNIGCTAFSSSTLLRKLNDSDYDGASLEFPRWSKQKGKMLPGLMRRRIAEAKLFNTDTA